MLAVPWFSIAITNTCWIADVVAAAVPGSVGGSSLGSAESGSSSAQPANASKQVVTQANRFMGPSAQASITRLASLASRDGVFVNDRESPRVPRHRLQGAGSAAGGS